MPSHIIGSSRSPEGREKELPAAHLLGKGNVWKLIQEVEDKGEDH